MGEKNLEENKVNSILNFIKNKMEQAVKMYNKLYYLASTNIISASLGEGALNAMLLAGVIAFGIIAIYMMIFYRLPGFVASIALFGQVVGTIACISGFFPNIDSFTLTIPGIAGIILAIGMGVDANVITAERIKEELNHGKTLNGAIELGPDCLIGSQIRP